MIIKRGQTNDKVKGIQEQLKQLTLYAGAIDGMFGPNTERAVKAFQTSRSLLVDGIVGPQTNAALLKATKPKTAPPSDPNRPREPKTAPPTHDNISACSQASWDRFEEFKNCLLGQNNTNEHVVYGPGRGLFVEDKWVVSYGPARLNRKKWAVKGGKTGPSLHCSSLTNLFLGFLLNYNEKWTHQGNMPSQTKMCLIDDGLHPLPQNKKIKYRGYGQSSRRLASNGDTAKRWKMKGKFMMHRLDAVEVWERRKELATFNMWAQSTRKGRSSKMKWDHHVGLFVFDHTEDRMWRLAADGYKGSGGAYSATPVRYGEVTEQWCKQDAHKKFYQIIRFVPDDEHGNFGVGRIIYPIGTEE